MLDSLASVSWLLEMSHTISKSPMKLAHRYPTDYRCEHSYAFGHYWKAYAFGQHASRFLFPSDVQYSLCWALTWNLHSELFWSINSGHVMPITFSLTTPQKVSAAGTSAHGGPAKLSVGCPGLFLSKDVIVSLESTHEDQFQNYIGLSAIHNSWWLLW